jgi:hypothetical protein
MEAAEAKSQRVLEGSKQFLVPHYQRAYSARGTPLEARRALPSKRFSVLSATLFVERLVDDPIPPLPSRRRIAKRLVDGVPTRLCHIVP